ncbi:MAG: gamma-glutamylcyclotransferase family protein [Chloroflexota bacterium]
MNYFAYASNLNKKQMQQRCPDSKPKFKATLPNYKLVFTGWSRQMRGGSATIERSRGDKVIGAIYEVSDKCLRQLDDYEGITYKRMNVNVFDEDGTAIEAVTYIKTGQMDEAKPSQEYLTVIQQGYRDWLIV